MWSGFGKHIGVQMEQLFPGKLKVDMILPVTSKPGLLEFADGIEYTLYLSASANFSRAEKLYLYDSGNGTGITYLAELINLWLPILMSEL